MEFSVPHNALILIADGNNATMFKNISETGISLQTMGEMPETVNGDRGAARTPHETVPHQKEEAGFVKHIANELYVMAQKNAFQSLVIVADPHTLGRLRTDLHQEVAKRITGELSKTLTNSSMADIEKTLVSAIS